MPIVSSSFRPSINNQASEQQNILTYPKGNDTAAKENGCESSSLIKQHHCAHVIDRTLVEFSNNTHHSNTNSLPMSAATASRSPFHHHVASEESYCAPWDLKTEEEKLKLLSEQRPTQLTDALLHPSNNTHSQTSSLIQQQNPFQRTRSARTTSFNKKTIISRDISPPRLPPLPPGGLISTLKGSSLPTNNTNTCQCNTNSSTRIRTIPNVTPTDNTDPSLKKISYCLNAHAVRSGTDTSRSFVFASSSPSNERSQSSTTSLSSIESPLITTDDTKPMSFEAALQRFKRLSSTTTTNTPSQETSSSSVAYERPWDTLQSSLINSLSSPPSTVQNRKNGDSLQRLPSADEHKLSRPLTRSPDEKKLSNSANTTLNNSNINNNSRSFVSASSENDSTIPIDRYFWYHYAMSRRAAESILQTRPPGSFLVRQSESGNQNDYSLSIRTAKSCMHMRICHSSGVYILGECSRPFNSVSRMIEYFSQTSVPIRGAAPIKLGTPVFRCETLLHSSPNHDMNDDLL